MTHLPPGHKDNAALIHLSARILSYLGKERARVDVAFLDNVTLRSLKRTYKKQDARYVNVLAFPAVKDFPDPDKKGEYLGEVFLNVRLSRPGSRRGAYLLTHGILHLLGYDHQKDLEAQRMEKKEKEVLQFLFSVKK